MAPVPQAIVPIAATHNASPLRIELSGPAAQAESDPASSNSNPKVASDLQAKSLTLPLRFEPNRGQASDGSQYIARSGAYEIHFSSNRAELELESGQVSPKKTSPLVHKSIAIDLEGADKSAVIQPAAPLAGKSNYIAQSDPKTWLTDLPNYGQLQYRQVYPGVDLVFYGNRGRLEYDFIVGPGSDPQKIALRLPAGSQAKVADSGDLQLSYDGAELQLLKPVAYQFANDSRQKESRQEVSGRYRIVADAKGPLVKFELGDYDHARPLIIDPVLSYATKTNLTGTLEGIAVDAAGNTYIVSTYSLITVTKLSSDGSTVLYSTSLGNSYVATATSIAVNSSGQAYFVAYGSAGYPTTNNSYRPVAGGGTHAILTVLNAAGDGLAYSTYILGSSTDYATHVAVDAAGKAYISGFTYSTDFPNTGAFAFKGYNNGFLVKMDPTLTGDASLIYANVIPAGYSYSSAPSVAVDANLNAYLAVDDDLLAVTPGAYNFLGNNTYNGGSYVMKFDSTGAMIYTAYLGYGDIRDIAVDGGGSVYVTGRSDYGDFPATAGAYQTFYPYGYVSKLDPTGATLVYSTFLGGPGGQVEPESIALPVGCLSNCAAYVAGSTRATDFPVINAIQNTAAGGSDAFIVTLSGDGSTASFSTYLGGSSDDDPGQNNTYIHIPQLKLDGAGNMYVGSNTYSSDFPYSTPTTYGPYIVRLSAAAGASLIPNLSSINFGSGTVGVPMQQSLILRNYGSAALTFNTPVITGDFSQTNSCGGTIAAGGSCTMQVSFTATLPGYRYGTLTITHNGNNSPTQVPLTGYAYDQAYLTLAPQQLTFAAQAVNTTSSTQTFTITNSGSLSANISNIGVYDPTAFAQTNNCPSVLPKGSSCTVSVTFTPNTVGSFSTAVYVSASAAYNGNSSVALSGSGTGVGTAAAIVSPANMQFADQVIGTQSPSYQTLTVTNNGTVPVTMTGNTISGDFLFYSSGCYSGQVLYPGGQCSLYVLFKPTALGARTGTVTIGSTAPGFPQALNLSGNGVAGTNGVTFSPAALVYADQVVSTRSAAQTITLSNVGNIPVTVERVYSTTPDFVITSTYCSLYTIPTLSSCTINVVFQPTTTGPLTGSIVVLDSDPSSPQTITLSGNSVTPTSSLYITPQSFTFDDTTVGVTTSTSITLTDSGNTPISVSSLTSDSTDFAITYNGCPTVSATYSCTFNVTFQPTTAGAKSATVTIVDSATGSPHTVSLAGNALASTQGVIATPQQYSFFNDQVVGTTSSSQQIVFYNPGTTGVTVTNAAASGDFAVPYNYCTYIYPKSYCSEYVTFTPTAPGLRTGTLTLFDTAPGSPHTVSLSGNGLSPSSVVVTTPSDVTFVDQVVGTTSGYQLIYFYNTGNTAVKISSLQTSGDFAIYSNGCSTTIPAGSYCYAYVTFTPTAPGARTGALTMQDDAPGNPHGANLSGNGLAANKTLTLSPGNLDFGNEVVNAASTAQTAYLVNTGTLPVIISSVTGSSNVTVSGCVTTLNPGIACAMSVTFKAAATGAQTGTVTINDDATGNPHTINLTANGVATAPATSLTPNGLAYAPKVVTTTSSGLTVTFNNTSGSSVTVSSVTASGDFTVSSNSCTVVPNNSSCSATLTFSPTAAGVRSGTVTFTHNGPGGQSVAALAGFGQASLKQAEVTPTGLAFTDQPLGSASSVQSVTFYNQGTVPVTVSNVTSSPDYPIITNGCSGVISNGCGVQVKFQPTTTGTRTGVLTITDDSPASPHTISLTGNGVSATNTLDVTGSQINFSDQPLNTTSSNQIVYVRNTGNTTINLNPGTISGDFAIYYSYCGTTLTPGNYCYFSLTFTPTALGTRSGSLVITSDSSSGTQTVGLAGNGIAATKTIAVTANALQFSDQPLGTSSQQQYFYIYNTGTVPVTFSAPTISGDFSIIYNGCPSSIGVGGYCYMSFQFTPTQVGKRTGTLQLNNDAVGSPQSVSLLGGGVAVKKVGRLSATSLTFADQAVGTTSATQYILLYNDGNVPLNLSSIVLTGDYTLNYYSCGTPPTAVSAGSYCYVYVAFAPTAAGTRAGSLTFTDDTTNSPHVVTITGKGLTPTPSITASTTAIVFPSQEVASTSGTQYVYLYSNSNVPITFTTPTTTNSDFAVSYAGCSSLNAPGQYCYIGLTFKPSVTGLSTGTLNIPSNANGSPLQITLSGTGIAAGTGPQLSQTVVNFGSQPIGKTSPGIAIYYSNSGAAAVVISSVVTTGDFTTNTGCNNATIYTHSYCAATITFKPTVAGTRTGTLTFTDNATGSPHVVTLSGTGVNTFPIATTSPSSLLFTSQLVGVATATQYVTVTNTGTAPLNFTSVTVSPTGEFNITSNGCTASLAPTASCYIYVALTPSAAGARSATLSIADDATGSPQQIPLTGTGLAATPIVAFSTGSVGFSSYGVGTTSPAAGVTLYNTGNAVLNITSITASAEFAQTNNCSSTLAANSNCAISLTFTPAGTGPRTGTLTVVDNAPGSPHVLNISGTGLTPAGSQVSPLTVVFPNQVINKPSAVQTVAVTSTGAALTVSSVSVTGTDFSQTNNCTTLGYNGTCYLSVTFTPTAVGTRNGTITVADSAPGSPHVISLSGTGTGTPAVTIAPTSLDFSSVNKGVTSTAQTITVTNTGNGPLGIGGIAVTGDYTQTNNCAPNLNANVSCTVTVKFTPSTFGTRTGTISVTDNAAGSPQTAGLTGIGLAPGSSVAPTSLTFTSQTVGTTSASQPVTLSNVGTVTMNISSIASNTSEFSQTSTCAATLAPSTSCTINVQFSPAGAGTRSGGIVITNDGGNITVPLTGTGSGPVASVDKSSLTFGSVAVGTPSTAQTVTLTSAGDAALTIGPISTSGDFQQTNNCPASLAITTSCTITVTFTPTAPGGRAGFLAIGDNAANSPQQVSLSGSGFGAAVSFNPSSLNFSTVLVGNTSSSQSTTLSNSGTSSLTITSISATGDFAETNNCPSVLAPSSSCTVNVTFAPTASGPRSGLLNVVGSSGTQSASLSGVGVVQGLTFSPGAVTFGAQPIGLTSAGQSVLVTAIGSLPVNLSGIVVTGDFGMTNNCPATLQPAGTCTVTVTFTPTQSGLRTGAVNLSDDAPGSPQTIALSGTGSQPTADLALSGSVTPKSGPPGGTATYNIAVSNNGPSQASTVVLTISAPTNSSLQSVTPSSGSCAGSAPIICTLAALGSGSTLNVVMVVSNTSAGAMTSSISVTANETDPNTANNSLVRTSDTSTADVQVVAASTTTTLSGQPAFTMAVVNNGPSVATGVVATYDLDRFGYVNSVASQGSCAWNGVQLVCALGSLNSGGSATVTIAVQPPDSGWTSVEARATSNQYDPVPANNLANITPTPDGYNTKLGTNVSVDTADPTTGATANLLFTNVTRPGITAIAAANGSAPPPGYRTARINQAFDVSTSAQFNGVIKFTLHFAPSALWHPAEARLFHKENGVWVDRTTALNPAGAIAGVTGSLSQFAIFEPPNQPPTANAGSAKVLAGTNASGNQVQLDASLSADPENDALTYKWTGPFPEGNGTVTGANPMVTLPLGASQVSLLVNDGEVDSAPVTQAVTVSDFAVAVNNANIAISRGSSTTINVALSPKWASYDRAVTFGCSNLPADVTCQFAQDSATPGANGSTVALTITAAKTSASLSNGHSPRTFAVWLLALGLPFGFVQIVGTRKRRLSKLLLLAILVAALYMVGCGGGGGGSSFQPQPTPVTGATSTINVTATSSGIQHTVAVTVTRN